MVMFNSYVKLPEGMFVPSNIDISCKKKTENQSDDMLYLVANYPRIVVVA